MRNFGKLIAATAVLLTGCATTGSPKDLGKLQYTGFTEKSDGSAYQSVMGLSCPSEIDGIPRTGTHVYNDGGTDVSCNYSKDGRIFTVYLSRFPDDNLEGNFRAAQYHLENRFKPQGYAYDDGLSDSCSSQSIDSSALLSGLSGILSGTSTSNNITLSPAPSAVYANPAEGKVTLAIVEEMFEKDFFKTRYTGPYSSAEDVDQVCETIRANYLEMKSSVGEARGLERSESDKLMDIINSSDDDS